MPRITKKTFFGTIREMRFYANSIFVLESLLSATLVFLILYLVLAFFRLYSLIAVIPAAIYFVYKLQNKLRINKLKMIEAYYPELEEKLRTAYDYRKSNNPIAMELKDDVVEKFNGVHSSMFLDTKKIATNSVLCLILCFLIIFLVPHSMNLGKYSFLLEWTNMQDIPLFKEIKARGIGEPRAGEGGGMGETTEFTSGHTGVVSRDIFGDYSLAELGEKTIEVKLKPSEYEFTLREDEDAPEPYRTSVLPKDIFAEGAETFEENIPKEKQQLVKNYFNEIGG